MASPALDKMLGFIDAYQQQRSHLSSINVVRSLRAYTRPTYASKFWELVAGKNPDFIKGELDDQSVVIMGKEIDFAHFIAALSDQSWGGNLFSTLSDGALWIASKVATGHGYDSREYTAAIGDTAQPIEVYLDKHGGKHYDASALQDLLSKFASVKDYDSDLVAFVVGRLLYKNPGLPIKDAILQADQIRFVDGARDYLTQMFGARFEQGAWQNVDSVKARVRDRIQAYLLIKRDAIRADILNRTYWKQVRPALINQAADHFITYLKNSI
ncbi:MAG: hypothetical protein AAF152_03765 [Cyanobacteria bacterium P01_A01_bin.114]